MLAADLHVHTTASDGTLTPTQIIAQAHKIGLQAIAITDHDTVFGISRAIRAGKRNAIKVIPGIELSTEAGGMELHILGYFINYKDLYLRKVLTHLRRARLKRIKQMTAKIRGLGLNVSWSRVLEIAGEGSVGRPHLARNLLENGHVNTIAEAFNKYIGQGCPAYIPRLKLTPLQAMQLIAHAQGVSVLAHPANLSDDLINKLVVAGLDGIEVYYPEHNNHNTMRLFRIAQKNRLLLTGGSDFHGSNRKDVQLAAASTPYVHLRRLFAARSRGVFKI